MRIVFMGSAELSCKSMDAILDADDIEVSLVVTQPQRRKGRALHMMPCPAHARALERGIQVFTPGSINSPESVARLKDCGADCYVIVAYGQILKSEVLDIPDMGCVNLHTSLLPKYRGAAPIQWAIANGEEVTGVTTMFINEKMDAGDILLQRQESIGPDDTGGSVHDRLAVSGADLLVETLRSIEQGTAVRTPQDDGAASYAPKLAKEDGRIDWTQSCELLCNRIRGFNPWPVCWFCSGYALAKKENCVVRVFAAEGVSGQGVPGTVLRSDADGIDIAAGDGAIRVLELQAEGGRRMDAKSFLRGHYFEAGKVIGQA